MGLTAIFLDLAKLRTFDVRRVNTNHHYSDAESQRYSVLMWRIALQFYLNEFYFFYKRILEWSEDVQCHMTPFFVIKECSILYRLHRADIFTKKGVLWYWRRIGFDVGTRSPMLTWRSSWRRTLSPLDVLSSHLQRFFYYKSYFLRVKLLLRAMFHCSRQSFEALKRCCLRPINSFLRSFNCHLQRYF